MAFSRKGPRQNGECCESFCGNVQSVPQRVFLTGPDEISENQKRNGSLVAIDAPVGICKICSKALGSVGLGFAIGLGMGALAVWTATSNVRE